MLNCDVLTFQRSAVERRLPCSNRLLCLLSCSSVWLRRWRGRQHYACMRAWQRLRLHDAQLSSHRRQRLADLPHVFLLLRGQLWQPRVWHSRTMPCGRICDAIDRCLPPDGAAASSYGVRCVQSTRLAGFDTRLCEP